MKKVLCSIATVSILFGLNANADVGVLTKIIDGDTVKFGNDTCRLANIDTPESNFNNRLDKTVKNCNIKPIEIIEAGKKSSKHLSTYLKVGQEYKYTVVTKSDNYGRKICLINIDNNKTVNLQMVEDGYAYPYYYYIPSQLKDKYKKALENAKINKKGLFDKNENVINCLEKGV